MMERIFFLNIRSTELGYLIPDYGHLLKQTGHKVDWFYLLNELGILTEAVFPH